MQKNLKVKQASLDIRHLLVIHKSVHVKYVARCSRTIKHSPVISVPLDTLGKAITQSVKISLKKMLRLSRQETRLHASATSKLTRSLKKRRSKVVVASGTITKEETETTTLQRKVACQHVHLLIRKKLRQLHPWYQHSSARSATQFTKRTRC